jgi:hypothetical protein
MFVSLSDSLIQCLYKNEKKANLVHEVAMSVCFGHKLANREFGVTKLPHASILVTHLHTWHTIFL